MIKNMGTQNRKIYIMLAGIIALTFWGGCGNSAEKQPGTAAHYRSFRDVPGVTPGEIKAVEALQKNTTAFVYGTTPSTEAFYAEDGAIKGFTALFSRWLSEFFGIPFQPAIYTWNDLIAGLESGAIDFTGELTATDERRTIWFMTGSIAERPLKMFLLADSKPLNEIERARRTRYGFLEGTTTINRVTATLEPDTYEIIPVANTLAAYDLLKRAEIDVFINEGPGEASLDEYTDVVVQDFFPPGYEPVSLSTRNPDLEPIISIVQKALQDGAIHYLTQLYSRGYRDYMQYKLSLRLTDAEKAYIRNNPIVRYAAEPDNYPFSFYDTRIKEWQGITADILDEVAALTGLTFARVNDQYTDWSTILHMLEDGDVAMVSDLIRYKTREGRFLWPRTIVTGNNYTLLSKSDFRDITINEIPYVRVGFIKDTAYATLFKSWFPDHEYTIEYDGAEKAFAALLQGEVDMVMARQTRILDLTNYRERVGYKTNVVFKQSVESSFGINKDEVVLCSIIDKALELIDTEELSGKWVRKTYDYRAKLMQAQRPLLFGGASLLLCVLILLSILFLRKRGEGKRLEGLVHNRTTELQAAVAELTKLQQELKTAVETAQAASQSKSKFLANMSHEMRTPLNAIIGLSEMELGTADLDKDTFINVEKIYSAGMNLLGIINDILDISKIESGKFVLVPIEYDVSSMINDTINLNIVRIGSKPIDFQLHVDGALPVRLEGDELRLKQIFNNLLSNAIKYTEAGFVEWSISTVREGNRVKIITTVKDTGKGISEEDQERLFSDYYQTDLKSNYYVEGTGLGLAITLNLIKLMDGTITLESEYRKGSAFTVEVYQESVGDEVIGDEAAVNLSQFRYTAQRRSRNQTLVRADMSYASVLVVDDVVTNLDVARGMLKPYNLNIECVTSGRDAIKRIQEEKIRYSAIFMDHMMPGMDGIEALRIIREEIGTEYAKNIPIIALTANALIGNDQLFIDSGFQAFLSKPIDILRMDQILQQWVRDTKKEKEMYAQGAVNSNPQAKGKNAALINDLDALGLSAAATLVRFANDAESYLRILNSFVTHAPPFIENARSSMADLAAYRIAVHSIKGSGRSIGADELGNIAEKLESAAKQGDTAYIESHNDSFIKAANDLIDSLSAFLSSMPDERDKTKPAKDAPDTETLAVLKQGAGNYDMAIVKAAIKTLDEYRYRSQPQLVKWLSEKIGKSDFASIEKRVDEIMRS